MNFDLLPKISYHLNINNISKMRLTSSKEKNMKLFSLQDNKADYFLPPMLLRNKGEAIRQIQQAMRKEDTPIAQDPESFTLVELGEFNQDDGIIKPYEQMKIIGTCSELQ